MNENTKSNLKNFQSDVFKRYASLMRQYNDAALFAEKGFEGFRKNIKSGVIKRNLLIKPLIAFRVKFHNFYVKSQLFTELERKATEIIENEKIKEILIPVLNRKISPEFFKEELEIELIIIVTTSLTKTKIVEEFSIEKDELLFSIIIRKILQQGIENYCAN